MDEFTDLTPRMRFTILEAMREGGTRDDVVAEVDGLTIKEARALRYMAEILMDHIPKC